MNANTLRYFSVALGAVSLGTALAACGGGTTVPRLIAGGGAGDGPIDGTLNVFVIDSTTGAPIGSASVGLGSGGAGGAAAQPITTDTTGLAVIKSVTGAQTIAVTANGYESQAWVGIDATNVTIAMSPTTPATPDQATISGSITGWDQITVATGHIKAAEVFYSQTANLGDAQNSLVTPSNGNICGVLTPTACNWTLVTRTGSVTLVAAIVDRDTKGTVDASDDTQTVIGWATAPRLTVDNGLAQTGVALTQVEAGSLQNITVDLGTPPAGLPTTAAVVGVEIGSDEVLEVPQVINTVQSTILMPVPSVFNGTTYRLTSEATPASGSAGGAVSIQLQRGLPGPTLTASAWLVTPTNLAITRSGGTWTPVAHAVAQGIEWKDSLGTGLLSMSIFDGTTATVTVPDSITLPTSGALTATVSGLTSSDSFDGNDFTLDDVKAHLNADATQNQTIN